MNSFCLKMGLWTNPKQKYLLKVYTNLQFAKLGRICYFLSLPNRLGLVA